jgi:molecular chaperone DnaK (HSP70)
MFEFFGLDLGTACVVLGAASAETPNAVTLVPNEMSGQTTPNVISLGAKVVLFFVFAHSPINS